MRKHKIFFSFTIHDPTVRFDPAKLRTVLRRIPIWQSLATMLFFFSHKMRGRYPNPSLRRLSDLFIYFLYKKKTLYTHVHSYQRTIWKWHIEDCGFNLRTLAVDSAMQFLGISALGIFRFREIDRVRGNGREKCLKEMELGEKRGTNGPGDLIWWAMLLVDHGLGRRG